MPVPTPQPPRSAPAPTEKQIAAAERISADTLYTLYSQNLDIGAWPDQRFFGRWMVVSGTLEGFNRDQPNTVYLELGTHDKDAFTYAQPSPEGASLLAALQPGEPVQLLCFGDSSIGGSPILRECRDFAGGRLQ